MFIEQTIKFDLRGLEPFRRTCTPATAYFYAKQKSLKKNFRVDYYLLLKYCRRQCRLPCFPLPGPDHLQNLTSKCKILRDLALTCKLK